MFGNIEEAKAFIEANGIEMVDFRMVDIGGAWRHVTIPASEFGEEVLTEGIGFDASNYGYAVVEKSDMVFIPDLSTAIMDPFCEVPTLAMTGNAMIIGHPENRPLPQYPRNIIRAAVRYMQESGIADRMLVLPEFEFYLFHDAGWTQENHRQEAHVDFSQAHWNSNSEGTGNIVPRQKNYHIAQPFDTTYDVRSRMVMHLTKAGVPVRYHHPEVGAGGQFEIEPQLGEVSRMADNAMLIKYIIRNTAQQYGMCATFMPKPIPGEAGSGMHVHMLLMKGDTPVFSDDAGYAHLSREAHYFMGGLLKHIASLTAITNPGTNSFKRLTPGFEAPVTVGYATSNRSAVIRIPAYARTPELRRFELRNPDALCNPYFAFSAILMAGLDGIKNRIDPHEQGWGPYDMNLFDLPEEEKAKLKGLPRSLEEALDALEEDHDYLTAGGVFPEELIRNMIRIKRQECRELSKIPTVPEFDRYFNG